MVVRDKRVMIFIDFRVGIKRASILTMSEFYYNIAGVGLCV